MDTKCDVTIEAEGITRGMAPSGSTGVRLRTGRAIALLLVIGAIALALIWTRTPVADYLTRDNVLAIADRVAGYWWAPLAIVVAYTPASLVMFPRWIITVTAIVMFGTVKGIALAAAGFVLAAIATYLPGKLLGQGTVRNLAGAQLDRIANIVRRRGFIAVTLVRLIPVAPFPVVNLAMGALRVQFRDFVLGTIIGMLPGTIAAALLGDQLATALEDPGKANGWLIGLGLATLGVLAYFGQRWLRRQGAANGRGPA